MDTTPPLSIASDSPSTMTSTRPSPSPISSAPAEGDVLASIPNDVILDILSRFPIKNVCRFRCVSRGWNSLISGPDFLAVHKSRSHPLLITCHDLRVELVDMGGNVLREHKTDRFSRVVPSSDGFVFTINFRDGDAKLMDLATGKVVGFTSLKPATARNTILGFGPATMSGAHKVVCVGPGETCRILTLEDGAGWRTTQSPPIHVKQHCSPVVIDGVLYALASSKQSTSQNPDTVICFDLESEEWNKVIKSPPKEGLDMGLSDHIGELTRTLCLVQSQMVTNYHGYANVWLLNDPDKSIWGKAYSIPMAFLYKFIPMPLTVMHGGKLLLYCPCTVTTTPRLKVYDPIDGTCVDAGTTLNQDGRFHRCNLDLGDFISAKK